jgi:hypothetical protein
MMGNHQDYLDGWKRRDQAYRGELSEGHLNELVAMVLRTISIFDMVAHPPVSEVFSRR